MRIYHFLAREITNFEFFKDIPSGSVSWSCPNCNEQNPYTFSIYWNCGNACNKDEKDNPDSAEFDLSHITGDKGANPYGPLNL